MALCGLMPRLLEECVGEEVEDNATLERWKLSEKARQVFAVEFHEEGWRRSWRWRWRWKWGR